jgi:hypothetical protein
MVNGGVVNYWACLNFSRNVQENYVHSFCFELAQMCQTSGMVFHRILKNPLILLCIYWLVKIRFCLPIKNFGQIFLLYFLVCIFSCELSMLAQASRMGCAPLSDTFLFLKYFKKQKMKSP